MQNVVDGTVTEEDGELRPSVAACLASAEAERDAIQLLRRAGNPRLAQRMEQGLQTHTRGLWTDRSRIARSRFLAVHAHILLGTLALDAGDLASGNREFDAAAQGMKRAAGPDRDAVRRLGMPLGVQLYRIGRFQDAYGHMDAARTLEDNPYRDCLMEPPVVPVPDVHFEHALRRTPSESRPALLAAASFASIPIHEKALRIGLQA